MSSLQNNTSMSQGANSLTKRQLKSRLQAMDIQVSNDDQKKQYYLDLYLKALEDKSKRKSISGMLTSQRYVKPSELSHRGESQTRQIIHRKKASTRSESSSSSSEHSTSSYCSSIPSRYFNRYNQTNKENSMANSNKQSLNQVPMTISLEKMTSRSSASSVPSVVSQMFKGPSQIESDDGYIKRQVISISDSSEQSSVQGDNVSQSSSYHSYGTASQNSQMFHQRAAAAASASDQCDNLTESSIKRRTKRHIFLYWISASILFLALYIGVKYSFHNDINFCDSDSSEAIKCYPCPSFGICKEGKLTCDEGYISNGLACIENLEKFSLKEKYMQFIEKRLSQKYGEFLCDSSAQYEFKTEEVVDLIRQQFSSDRYYQQGIDLVIQTLRSIEEIGYNNYQNFEIFYDWSTQGFHSKVADPGMACKIRLFCTENVGMLVIIVLITAVTSFNLVKWILQKRSMSLAFDLYEKILIDLRSRRVACAKELHDQLAKQYGTAKIKLLWPVIESIRLNHQQILVFKDEYNGKSEIFWKL